MKTKATKLNQKMNFKEVARHSFKHSLRFHQFHQLTEAPYHHQIASDTIKQQQQQQQNRNFHHHQQQQHSLFFLVCLAFNFNTIRKVI